MAKAQLNNGYATTVYFDKETSEAAKTLAGNLKISMSAYLRLLVQKEFAKQEHERLV